MYMQDISEYIKFGDEVILHLYGGTGIRGVYTDRDDTALFLYFSNGSERYKKIVPADQIEYISIIEKVVVTKIVTKKVKADDSNKTGRN